jgi:hypothetical protein
MDLIWYLIRNTIFHAGPWEIIYALTWISKNAYTSIFSDFRKHHPQFFNILHSSPDSMTSYDIYDQPQTFRRQAEDGQVVTLCCAFLVRSFSPKGTVPGRWLHHASHLQLYQVTNLLSCTTILIIMNEWYNIYIITYILYVYVDVSIWWESYLHSKLYGKLHVACNNLT